jgi:hypothetical protein
MPSRSRPKKPPAKELSRRKAAATSSRGGGKLPPRIRKELDREPMPKRTGEHVTTSTRAGKREPKAQRRDDAADMRDARKRAQPR